MSLCASNQPPPGWYPDPGGERQWRVWTGTKWSEVTRPYGESLPSESLVGSLGLIHALHLLVRYGVVAAFSGLGLMVSAVAHRPGTLQPTPQWFTDAAFGTGVALVLFATVVYGWTLFELEGRIQLWTFVPLLNIFAVGALVSTRLGAKSPALRIFSDALLMALFVFGLRSHPWLAVAIALVALGHAQWTSALLDQLTSRGSSQLAS